MIVRRRAADTSPAKRRRVYLAVDHEAARGAWLQPGVASSPECARGLAYLFVASQNRPEATDHDLDSEWFKVEIQESIETARGVIRDLETAGLQERRALAVHVLFQAPTT